MRLKKLSMAAAVVPAVLLSGAGAERASAQSIRAEVHGGWDRVTNDIGKDGIVYGVGLGIDFRLGKRVTAGLEADADLSTVKECGPGVLAPRDKLCLTAKRDLSAVARIGYNIAEQSQIYALAGYTNARFRVDYTPPTGAATHESGNSDGLRLGAGFQQGFGNGLYSKIEYRYSNYEAGAERHQVIAGLGIAF